MTKPLYYHDPYIQKFQARVIEQQIQPDGTAIVILAQTAFYPTGGGQPHDTGRLAGIDVLDVQSDETGVIRHTLAAPLAERTDQVDGYIDWERRFDHMQQHAGQHVLSAVFEQLFDADTVGFHLGKDTVTVDIAMEPITPNQWLEAEKRANEVILNNLSISPRFVDDAELASFTLRHPPKVDENVRLVIMEGFDVNPCGGTHPSSTGQIGLIKIIGTEKSRDATRIEFVCGWRALTTLHRKQEVLREIQRKLSASEADLPNALDKLLQHQRDLEKEVQTLKIERMTHLADALRKEAVNHDGRRLIARIFHDLTMKELQSVAKVLTAEENTIVMLVSNEAAPQVVLARSTDVPIAMNECFKSITAAYPGKGGGSSAIAQGGLEPGPSLQQVLMRAKEWLTSSVAN